MKLLRKLSSSGEYKSLKYEAEFLNDFNQKTIELRTTIDEISKLRNQFYAHTDSDPFQKIESTIMINDCERLTNLAEEIIRSIASQYLGIDYLVYPLYYNSKEFDLIYNLAQFEQQENIRVAEQLGMSFLDLFGYEPLN